MVDHGTTRIKRLRRNLRLTSAIVLLAVGVLLPVLLSTLVGIITLVSGDISYNLILGILTIAFTSAAIGSAIMVTVLLSRRARTARLQSDFLANITHELRTPLSSIRMYAQTLQSGVLEQDPARMATSIDTIIRETEWLETLIDRVLTWRTAAKDQIELDMVVEPIGPAVADAGQRFVRMLPPGEVDFVQQIESQALVRHDSRAIGSIVLNLLSNAYKYTEEDKRIRLELEDGQDEVIIRVEDNGPGIPKREHGRMFDPFYRVEAPGRSSTSGAGLGLAIVRHMVREHEGAVSVESEADKGATFLIHLPVAHPEEPEN